MEKRKAAGRLLSLDTVPFFLKHDRAVRTLSASCALSCTASRILLLLALVSFFSPSILRCFTSHSFASTVRSRYVASLQFIPELDHQPS
eukprot:4207482-Pleurochrysis_carterae.AAC.1